MKKIIFILLAAFAVSCGTQQEKANVKAVDSTKIVSGPACNCEQLQMQVDSLNMEIKSLKKSSKKKTEKADKTEKEEKTGKPVVHEKAAKAAGGKRDSDGSIRCSAVTNGERCKKRTFSKNGLCWQHGGD